jgi:hypothetical protein
MLAKRVRMKRRKRRKRNRGKKTYMVKPDVRCQNLIFLILKKKRN